MNTVMNKISDQDLAALHTKFVVPLAVGQILKGQQPLDDVSEYVMHDIIGELQPDTALLCLALCAQNIAAHTSHLPIARALRIEAEMIIEDYGPAWLAGEQGVFPEDPQELRDLLCYIPEDLESLADLLDATLGELDEQDALAGIICDILSQQALAHKDCAEEELRAAGLESRERPGHDGACSAAQSDHFESGSYSAAPASNIIPFPAR